MNAAGGSPGGKAGNAPTAEESSTLLYVIVSLAVVGIAVLLFYFFIRRQSHKLQFVLLLGRNGAGKTTLFAKLTQDRSVLAVSSLVKNIAWTKNLLPSESGREIQLIDVPGFERIRWAVFEANKSLCKGIVFVVDSVTINKDGQECADILYRILTDPEIQRKRIPVLIVCNKQDEVAAKDMEVVSDIMEKELNSIRITKYNPSTKKGNKNEFLGKPDTEFTFSQLRTNKVTLAKCIAGHSDSTGKDSIEDVQEFLRTLA